MTPTEHVAKAIIPASPNSRLGGSAQPHRSHPQSAAFFDVGTARAQSFRDAPLTGWANNGDAAKLRARLRVKLKPNVFASLRSALKAPQATENRRNNISRSCLRASLFRVPPPRESSVLSELD